MTFCLLHLPDALCFYRIFASIVALILGPHPLTPWLFSTALTSDLFDGYIFRKYVVNHPQWRNWWPLSTSPDPLSDLTLATCGIIYACIYLYHNTWLQALIYAIIYIIFAFLCVTLPKIVPKSIARPAYLICINATTHITCLLMLHAAVAAWAVQAKHWIFCSVTTIAIFYLIFAKIGTHSRLIRRPPAHFRQDS